MLSDGSRKLNLYEFFSVLLPGVAFLLAMLPFAPQDLPISNTAALVPLLVGGFIVGQAIHTMSVSLERWTERNPPHRERFASQFEDPEAVTPELVREFKSECKSQFDSVANVDTFEETHCEDIYALVRSYIHMDARGRSRTFQATYAFCRSMWVLSLGVGCIYFAYAVGKSWGLFSTIIPYMSYIGAFGFDPLTIGYTSAFVGLGLERVFSTAKESYQKNYIQYLFVDFLILQGLDYPEAVVAAADLDDVTNGGNGSSEPPEAKGEEPG